MYIDRKINIVNMSVIPEINLKIQYSFSQNSNFIFLVEVKKLIIRGSSKYKGPKLVADIYWTLTIF